MSNQSPNTKRRRIVVVLLAVLFVTLGHYVTPPSFAVLHSLFQHLYFLPIVLAALHFGWPGGLLAAGGSAICYLPHIFMWWQVNREYAMSQYTELGAFFVLGAVTGLLADRERKRTRELERATEELEVVYQELKNSVEQVKRAERLAAVGQLAASLAHEIRNPLASIEGAVSVLNKQDSPEELRREFRGIIAKECGRLKGLLTDLLNFARPRMPEYHDVDVSKKMDAVITLVAHAASQNEVTVRKTVDAKLPLLECDPEQFLQIVLNLTLNAIQAMPAGGEVILSARRQDSNMSIEVKDQGTGIQPETIDRVFDPFFTTKEHGTGLGLSVAHQIVAQHGGSIKATRNPDKGMTFSIILPLDHG